MLTVLPTGEVEFEIILSEAGRVEILGDFTGWEAEPAPMTQGVDGRWTARLRIGPGEHQFKYRIDGGRWLADFAAHGVHQNDFGTWNSGLFIPHSGATASKAA